MRLLADELARGLDDLRHAGHAADEHEFVDFCLGESSASFKQSLTGVDGALEKRIAKLLHLGAGELSSECASGPLASAVMNGRLMSYCCAAESAILAFSASSLMRWSASGCLREIHAAVLLEFVEDPIHERVVPVVTAEVRVAVGGLHLEDAVADFEHGDVERAAAQVVHRDLFVLLLVEAVGERGGGRLVDDAEHFEARDLAGVLGGLALGVVEISRNRDDGLGDLFAELGFRIGLQFAENHRGNFRRRERLLLAVHFDLDVGVAVGGLHDLVGNAMFFFADLIEFAAHETLDRENGVGGIGDRLALGGLADESFASLCECDDRRRGARPSEFSRTTGSPPSMTAMQELVVPKSIPKTFAIVRLKSFRGTL